METVHYEAIRGELKTGDIVLFSGRGAISKIIQFGTLSQWSHCGLVLKLPEYDFLTIWESTTLSDQVDLETFRPRKGVQLVPLSDRVHTYSGRIAVRQLRGGGLGEHAVRNLMSLRRDLRGKHYEKGKLELLFSALDGPFDYHREDLSSIFCSELVAEAYQCLHLLTEYRPSNEYTPADFSAKKLSKLTGSYYLDGELLIKDDEYLN